MNGRLTGASRVAVPASLLLSFAANDGEELLTMAATTGDVIARLPAPLRHRLAGVSPSQRHVAVGVAVVALLYSAAAVDGVRTAGRGRLYQDIQRVFGLHGYFHVAASLLTRGYTSGVATSPTVVLPVWWWARRRLRDAGVPDVSHLPRAIAVLGGWLLAAHACGAAAGRLGEG